MGYLDTRVRDVSKTGGRNATKKRIHLLTRQKALHATTVDGAR